MADDSRPGTARPRAAVPSIRKAAGTPPVDDWPAEELDEDDDELDDAWDAGEDQDAEDLEDGDEDQDEDQDEDDEDDEPAVTPRSPALAAASVPRRAAGPGYGSALLAQLLEAVEADNPRPPPAATSRPAARAGGGTGGGKGGLVGAVLAGALVLGAGGGVLFATGLIGGPSKSAYLAKADAVCARTDAALAATPKPATYPSLANAAGAFSAAADAQLAQLRRLKRPGGGARSGAAAVLRAMDATTQAGHRLQTAAAGGDDTAVANAGRDLSAVATDAGARAKAFGFKACGAGLGQGTGALVAGTKDLVKAAVVRKGNALCQAAERAFAAIPTARSAKDLVPDMNRAYDINHKLVADLKALPVAPGDEATVGALVAGFNRVDATFGEARDALVAGNLARFEELSKDTDADIRSDKMLDDYGLVSCGSGFSVK